MALGNVVLLIFSVIFLFYTNSFLIRRRRREFGLYNVLGHQAAQAAVHDADARLFVRGAKQLAIAEPGKEIFHRKLRECRCAGERAEFAVCAAAENVDQVAENFIFKADAVEKDLKNVARLGFHRLRRFGGFIRLRRALGGELRDGGVQVVRVKGVIVSLRDGLAGLRGAAADKLRDADGLDLGLQLDGLFQIVRLMQREALRQRPLPLADLGNELQIVWN